MELNNIYLRFLIFGVVTSIFLVSCSKKTEPARFGEFNFVNKTSHLISFKYSAIGPTPGTLKKYDIPENSITVVMQTQESNPTANAEDFNAPFYAEGGYPDPLIVIFDDSKCLTFTKNEDKSPLDIKNYESENLGKRRYKFTYTFTEADYERALACP